METFQFRMQQTLHGSVVIGRRSGASDIADAIARHTVNMRQRFRELDDDLLPAPVDRDMVDIVEYRAGTLPVRRRKHLMQPRNIHQMAYARVYPPLRRECLAVFPVGDDPFPDEPFITARFDPVRMVQRPPDDDMPGCADQIRKRLTGANSHNARPRRTRSS
ncbi:hypothetical protein D3C71_1267870 [compost metagenome]